MIAQFQALQTQLALLFNPIGQPTSAQSSHAPQQTQKVRPQTQPTQKTQAPPKTNEQKKV